MDRSVSFVCARRGQELLRAIELDPLKPKFLKTIRGVGYRLDV